MWTSRNTTATTCRAWPKNSPAWCVERKVKLLGVEPPSVADVNNKEEPTHIHAILGEGVIVEGLTNPDQV
jgi:kynurenine formamidase